MSAPNEALPVFKWCARLQHEERGSFSLSLSHITPPRRRAARINMSHRVGAVRESVCVGLAWRGERGRLADDHRLPVQLPGRGEEQRVRLALLAQAVVSQGPRRAERLQGFGVLVLRVRQWAVRASCQSQTLTNRKR